MIMTATAVLGLSAGKRLFFGSAFVYPDLTDKLVSSVDPPAFHVACSKSSEIGANRRRRRRPPLVTAVREHVDTTPTKTCTSESWMDQFTAELVSESSVDSILLLHKYMLEKQWNLSSETRSNTANEADQSETVVTASGTSARRRRLDSMKRKVCRNIPSSQIKVRKQGRSGINPGFVTNRARGGYMKGAGSEELLTHSQVVDLSQYIKTGLMLEKHRSRLKERLGSEPSHEQLAHSLRISKVDLHTKLTESKLAREKLARSNVRLVMSIAQKYDHMGVEMADLVQGGLIGLLRGIEKFDSSKGFKISTYVYWWIRQGVSRSLMENSKTLRLPTHLHERLSLIRNAKAKLAEKGIAPTIPKIAECLNMTEKKVRNATEAINKVFSLDREAFPSKNGLRGETHHSYVADTQLNNNPWHGYDKWALKDEVDKLITLTLREREREIVRLYYGIGNECLTWEDISRRMGLSRERVRQVGLVAMEKLKHAARKRRLDALLVKH